MCEESKAKLGSSHASGIKIFLALMVVAVSLLTVGNSQSRAQTPLSSYVDVNGFIDVQKLTCAQMANAPQLDIDMLTAWYSGWYNGLAHKHFMHYSRTMALQHDALAYCQAHPERRVIDALAAIFRDERSAGEMPPRQALAEMPAAVPLQSGTIHVSVFSAGLIVGAGGGEGTLTFDGVVYPISVGGIGLGTIGFAGGEVDGVAYNMRRPTDIAGTYGAAGAGFTVIGGARVAQLQNENGVIIQVHGVQIGLEVNLNLAGMTVAMK
jgi:hypothetical protein